MDWFPNPEIWIALTTLTALEIVLGIDNIVLISILSGKLPEHQRDRARKVGLSLAMITRVLLLFSLSLIVRLTAPLFEILGQEISGRDLVLILGGLFLIAKSTHEIHGNMEGEEEHGTPRVASSFTSVIIQILLLDIVFSLDSVITAVGMVNELGVMVAAVIIAVLVMLVASGVISEFVNRHPTVKMLALSFLLLVGITLIADGLGSHFPKGYIYGAMAFSVFVEALNLRAGHRSTPRHPAHVHLQYSELHDDDGSPKAADAPTTTAGVVDRPSR